MPSTQAFGLQCSLLSKLQHRLQFTSMLSGKPCREVFGTNTAFADFCRSEKTQHIQQASPVGRSCQDRLDSPADGLVQQGRRRDCAEPRIEEGLAERPGL